ncbi:MAG TPA: SIR2 family protein [Solirubrobacterales bacterium]|nr:SIR2 family protein [Solirubrobacterales bacterium]
MPTVFINYRKAEAAGWARLLYDRLATEFGVDNVFLDQVTLQPGVRWLQGIRSGSSGCTAFIALIGPRWAQTLAERAGSGVEDYVRSEIETALAKGSQVQEVIPALIEGAKIPRKDDLRYVGSVKPLLNRQQVELRPASWDTDLQRLIERLKQQGEAAEAAPERRSTPAPRQPPLPAERDRCDEIASLLLEEGSLVVPFLGPGTNSEELTAQLAAGLEGEPPPAGLAHVSQQLSVAKGPGDLYMALRRALPSHPAPGPVHRFLAGLPARLHALGAPDRYQLIVTTNYDSALEQAFAEAEEAFDLAVYLARGRDKGRFVHIPHDGEPRLVTDPNAYTGFPIDAFGRVERTVVMKVHGGVDRAQGPHPWRDNYVITEDDYIDYMSFGDIATIVPQQLLGKLRDYSHFLFLGHEMRDWSLRVFLIRVFGDRGQPNSSWAVQQQPSKLDERFWQRLGVALEAVSLDEFAEELDDHLARMAAARPSPEEP